MMFDFGPEDAGAPASSRDYADAMRRDPLGDPRLVRPAPPPPRRSPVRLRWVALGIAIALGLWGFWA
ncbi:hypothetical protein [Roseobacter sp. HKCCA0434]|uniref:hypothetical protein n=1 Tax=Roseobacter sp. HKCCA0434 TaxID=3079297 RepID=UPI002905ED3B|nr:hypothetical protein [Roseobacter sp. HKCCA0434]